VNIGELEAFGVKFGGFSISRGKVRYNYPILKIDSIENRPVL
jgi:hypothetical protein